MNAVGHSVVLTVTSCHNNPQHAVTGKYISVYDRNKSLFLYWFSFTNINLPSISLTRSLPQLAPLLPLFLSFRSVSELKTVHADFYMVINFRMKWLVER